MELENNSAEYLKMKNDVNIHNSKLQNDVNIELFKSVLTSANNAIKTLMIINGGAAISLLTFIGKLATESKPQDISLYALACLGFGFGVFFSAIAAGGTYFSQYYFHRIFEATILKNHISDDEKENYSQKEKNASTKAYYFRWATIAFACLALASFLLGGYQSYDAFVKTTTACI